MGLMPDSLTGKHMIGSPTINMRMSQRRFLLRSGLAALILILLWAVAIGPEPSARIAISPDELVRAVTIQHESLIDLYLIERVDPNGRDAQGRTPLLIATAQQDWKTARRLIDAGATVDLADKNGFTPLMAAAMHGDTEMFRLLLARSTDFHPEKPCADGQDLLAFALDGGNPEIIKTVLQRLPPERDMDSQHASRFVQSAPNRKERRNPVAPQQTRHAANTRREERAVSCVCDRQQQRFVVQHTPELRSGSQHGSAIPLRQGFPGAAAERTAQLHRRRPQCNRADARRRSRPGRLLARSHRCRRKSDSLNDPEQNVCLGSCCGDRPLAVHADSSGGGPAPDKLRIEISLAMQKSISLGTACRCITRDAPRGVQVIRRSGANL